MTTLKDEYLQWNERLQHSFIVEHHLIRIIKLLITFIKAALIVHISVKVLLGLGIILMFVHRNCYR